MTETHAIETRHGTSCLQRAEGGKRTEGTKNSLQTEIGRLNLTEVINGD